MPLETEVRALVQEMGRDIGEPKSNQPDVAPKINPEYFVDLEGLAARFREMPADDAFVLNMNPYPLRLNAPNLLQYVIPACPADQPFVAYRFSGVSYEMKLTGEGAWTPVAFPPYITAKAYAVHQNALARGGVVWYVGDKDPLTNPKIQSELATAKALMIHFGHEKMAEANNEWNTPGRAGARNISDLHRSLALMLLRMGELDAKPEWLTTSLAESNKGDKCPGCMVRPERGAMMCKHCGYVLDPRAAFDEMMIDETHTALCRLSRPTLLDMGISEFVKETQEERRERLSASRPPVVPKAPTLDEAEDEDLDYDEGGGQQVDLTSLTEAERSVYEQSVAAPDAIEAFTTQEKSALTRARKKLGIETA